jgi:hypothetical protein
MKSNVQSTRFRNKPGVLAAIDAYRYSICVFRDRRRYRLLSRSLEILGNIYRHGLFVKP